MPLNRIATAAFRTIGAVDSVHGSSALEAQFTGRQGKIVRPCSGFDRFLRLDSPRGIDSNGVRKPNVQAANVAAIVPPIDHGGARTHPGDGAWLECNHVTIPAGSALRFHWGFLRFDGLPGNDFCAFEPEGEPLVTLAQIFDLEMRGNANQTRGPGGHVWIEHVWKPSGGFSGRLRWIVANAELVLSASDPPTGLEFVRPSAMVLCGLDIS
ncbi:MAG: hypothetical protein ACR2RF_27825 [Geminicoccaceae bacterium]